MVPNKRASKGSITFDKNGTYEMHEQLQDGSGVGTKGEYKLNNNENAIFYIITYVNIFFIEK